MAILLIKCAKKEESGSECNRRCSQRRFSLLVSERNGNFWDNLLRGVMMKQLVIDILMKMAKIEVDAKELTAQVEAQSLLVAALLLTAGKGDGASTISDNIQNAIVAATTSGESFLQSDIDLLLTHINRLLAVTRYVDEKAEAQ
jgi:hypothetical protein